MKPGQARGYILENVVLELLEEAGYVDVKPGHIRGRGADHQIDAYGVLSIPTAFIYPIRLLSEAKFYKKSIELNIIRNFVGVIKDISENYFVTTSHKHSSFRYTDAGCIFSATPFDESAQEYAWAHNIFLISFADIETMKPIIDTISLCVQYPGLVAVLNDKSENKQRQIIKIYKKIRKGIIKTDYPTLVIGILDNIYPVILVGKKGWVDRIDIPQETDTMEVDKKYRQDFPETQSRIINNRPLLYHIFHIKINGEPVEFNIPNCVAKRIIERINDKEKKIAELQIPLIDKSNGKSVRRIIFLNVKMP
jgi:hypothetical protein